MIEANWHDPCHSQDYIGRQRNHFFGETQTCIIHLQRWFDLFPNAKRRHYILTPTICWVSQQSTTGPLRRDSQTGRGDFHGKYDFKRSTRLSSYLSSFFCAWLRWGARRMLFMEGPHRTFFHLHEELVRCRTQFVSTFVADFIVKYAWTQ